MTFKWNFFSFVQIFCMCKRNTERARRATCCKAQHLEAFSNRLNNAKSKKAYNHRS